MTDVTQTQTGSTPLKVHTSDRCGNMVAVVQSIALTGKGAIPLGFAINPAIHATIPVYSGKNTTVVELTKAEAQAAINAMHVVALDSSLNAGEKADLSEDVNEAITQPYELSSGVNKGMYVSMFGHMLKAEMGKLESAYKKAENNKALAAAEIVYIGAKGLEYVAYSAAQKSHARALHKDKYPTIAGDWYSNPAHKARLLAEAAQLVVIVNKGETAPAPAVATAPVTESIQTTLMEVGALAPDVSPPTASVAVVADPAMIASLIAQGQTPEQAIEGATEVARILAGL